MAACETHGRFRAGCPRCQRADRAYGARKRRMVAEGTWLRPVAAETVLAHIATLRVGGMSLVGIARCANLPEPTIQSAVYESRKVFRGPIAAAILAVEPQPTVPIGHVLPHGVGRRVRSLVADGYTMSALGVRLGRQTSQVWELAWEKSGYVADRTHRAVADLFEEIADIPGPSVRARNIGIRRGWPTPDAWADVDIDDPNAEPYSATDAGQFVDTVAVDKALAGSDVALTSTERHHAVHVAIGRGMSLTSITERLHVSKTTVRDLAAQPLPAGFELVA